MDQLESINKLIQQDQSQNGERAKMKSNIGGREKISRFILGAILILAGLFGGLPAWGAAICYGLAAIAIITGMFNFCPLWAILGINTRKF
jgi:DUF2892 family protein